MTSVFAFVFVLSVLVFVHELGHFMMARRIGVRVLTFSLGFGPKLLKFRRGDTEYCVSAIPLGGYVKMAGENEGDRRTGADDEFMSKTKWQRFQVLAMGPAMNVALSIVVIWVVLLQGAEIPAFEDQPAVVGRVVSDSPAERAGIQVGERIIGVAGRSVETWDELLIAVLPRAQREISIVVRDSGGAERTVRLTPDAQTDFELGDIGVGPIMRPQVRGFTPSSTRASDAGILVGDVIEAIDGEPATSETLIKTINEHAGTSLTLTVRRSGGAHNLVVTPELVGDIGLIGVSLSPYEVRVIEPGPIEAAQLSLARNYEWSGLIFQTIWGLLTVETSPRQLVGPVGIAQLSGGAAEAGWIALFNLMAMISLNLGIINLLPIPVLDGGHIFILALEGVARRDFSVRVKERMLLAGFVVLMMLMVTVIYNDLTRIQWIEALMPWR